MIPALTGKNDLILSDKLNHASIVDGIRLSVAKHVRYKHLDYEQLENILSEERNKHENVFIVSETIFSMDGDICDLKKLVELKQKYNCILYIDEAHAFGTRGEKGLGIAEEQNTIKDIDIIVGTFGKSVASLGAFVVCDTLLRSYLINKMRSFIYTTALPSVNVAWTLFICKRIVSYNAERENLKKISDLLIQGIKKMDFKTNSLSNIIPLIIGDNKKTTDAAVLLQNKGFWILPIKPPTVAPDTARLRISLTSDINESEVKNLIECIREINIRH